MTVKDRMVGRFNLARFVWEKKSLVRHLPFVYDLYRLVMGFLYRDDTVVTIRRGPVAGYKWRHYRVYQPWMAMGMYEPHVAHLIHDELKPGDVFYDIGANAGYFTLVAAKAVGSQGWVVAFDPVPQNARTIQEQIDLNDLGTCCKVEPLAISDRCGEAGFIVTERNANAHLAQVHPTHFRSRGGQRIEVTSTTLDAYVKHHPHPTLVKMDVEGAEVIALQGACELLHSAKAPRLLVSTHGAELEQQVKDILRSAGYSITNLKGFAQMVYGLPKGGS